ncbi:hypothetical protein, partial [Streptomyces laurentii]|uniref:hypothetical protein n=1 Tax=Streptomyces laurentii TaxID=39478 RepID=UPI003691F690
MAVLSSHRTENDTQSDSRATGSRTSTRIRSRVGVPGSYADWIRVTCSSAGPSAGKSSVRHAESWASPLSVRQRYVTVAGVRSTVSVAVNSGAPAAGGGQLPVYAPRAARTETATAAGGVVVGLGEALVLAVVGAAVVGGAEAVALVPGVTGGASAFPVSRS